MHLNPPPTPQHSCAFVADRPSLHLAHCSDCSWQGLKVVACPISPGQCHRQPKDKETSISDGDLAAERSKDHARRHYSKRKRERRLTDMDKWRYGTHNANAGDQHKKRDGSAKSWREGNCTVPWSLLADAAWLFVVNSCSVL